jgi:L-2-hydroxyglutarate oxidase LhgO
VDDIDALVIGAGVIGLAVARSLAMAGREVVVLESAETIGTGTSSRNSEVIHAGIYYSPGSLKASLCVAGRQRLYEFIAERGIAHRRCGKLIVATARRHEAELQALLAQAEANGVHDLTWMSQAELRNEEPALDCLLALRSPSTGIVDSHQLMLALQGDAEDHGAMIAFNTPVLRGCATAAGIELTVGGVGSTCIRGQTVVNCAGLAAQSVAAAIEGFPREKVPPSYFCKGSYFALAGRTPFSHLIYPVPEAAGLGVHLTLDLAGQARFGPDVQWVEQLDYDVDPQRSASFYAAIRRYWPALADGALMPAYSGIRPKIQAPGEPARDFMIQGPRDHGIAGLVNLFGIESPGLTAAMAIAAHVTGLLTESE